jgi:hypothetical protein
VATSKFIPREVPDQVSPDVRQYLDDMLQQVAALLNPAADYIDDATIAHTDADEVITGDWDFDGALDLTGATISGLSSDDLSDVSSIAMLDENETVTGDWIFSGKVDIDGSANNFRILGDIAVPFPPTTQAVTSQLRFTDEDASMNLFSMGFGGNNQFIATHFMRGGPSIWKNTTAGGSLQNMFALYPGNVSIFYSNNAQRLRIEQTSAHVILSDGAILRLRDATNTDYTDLYDDGTNVNLVRNSAGGSLDIEGFDTLRLFDGINARIHDSSNAYFSDLKVDATVKSPNSLHYLIDSSQGGEVHVQAVSIADDATATFEIKSYAMCFIISTYNRQAFAQIAFTTTQAPEDLGSGPLVSVGASNPDVDGNVNIWPSASGEFSIKNRLGSTRSFYVLTFQI